MRVEQFLFFSICFGIIAILAHLFGKCFKIHETKNTLDTAKKVLEADKRLKARFDEAEELRKEKRRSKILAVILLIVLAYILITTIF